MRLTYTDFGEIEVNGRAHAVRERSTFWRAIAIRPDSAIWMRMLGIAVPPHDP